MEQERPSSGEILGTVLNADTQCCHQWGWASTPKCKYAGVGLIICAGSLIILTNIICNQMTSQFLP